MTKTESVSPEPMAAKRRIFIVDDHTMFREGLRQLRCRLAQIAFYLRTVRIELGAGASLLHGASRAGHVRIHLRDSGQGAGRETVQHAFGFERRHGAVVLAHAPIGARQPVVEQRHARVQTPALKESLDGFGVATEAGVVAAESGIQLRHAHAAAQRFAVRDLRIVEGCRLPEVIREARIPEVVHEPFAYPAVTRDKTCATE